jgi:hypothetical protein
LGEILAVAGVSPAQITPVAAINLKHDRTIENIVFVEVFINPKVGQCCFWQDYLSTVKSNNRVPIIDYGFAGRQFRVGRCGATNKNTLQSWNIEACQDMRAEIEAWIEENEGVGATVLEAEDATVLEVEAAAVGIAAGNPALSESFQSRKDD